MPYDIQKMIWPGWETVKLIGRGSFGAVYEIQRDVLGDIEKAALKVISIPQNGSDIDELYSDGYDDESITSTFQSHLKSIVAEYTLMRKMNGSANIVNCDDIRYVQHDDGIGWDIFIKMELLTPLTKSLPANIPEETVVKIAKDICAALELCKKYGIIHRDIKPQNIFVSPNGDYKLGDFGIAKTIEKTTGGTKIGTYKYMAPEVYNNQPYGSAADIYSLGLVLYWLLNERRMPFLPLPPEKLFSDIEESARIRRFSGEKLPPPAHGSKRLQKIVLKACAFSPDERYASAEEMLEDLKLVHTPEPEDNPDDKPVDVPPVVPDEPPHEGPLPNKKPNWMIYAAVCCLVVGLLVPIFRMIKEKDPCAEGHQWIAASCTAAKTCSVCSVTDGDSLGHSWVDATCTTPKTCSSCGTADGDPAGHRWVDASCTVAKTCSVCSETDSDPLGHSWIAASCETPKTCSACNAIEGAALGHQWQEATSDRPKTCINCSKTEGTSLLQNVELYPDGRIKSGYEYVNGKKYEWIYCYDENNVFIYRKRMIDKMGLTWSNEKIPKTDMSYQNLDQVVDNCIGFTFIFNITNVPSGTGRGERTLLILDKQGNWETILTFDYPKYEPVELAVELDEPVSLAGIGTLKVHLSDNNIYSATGELINIWVADFEY